MEDPYKPPESDVTLGINNKGHDYRLFKISGVGLATFFGTVLAGGYLIYRNYKNLGKDAEAKNILIWSGIAAVVIFGISFLIPESVAGPNIGLTIAQVVVMTQLAKKWFEDDLLDHEVRGDAFASNWLAFGIALLVLLLILLLIATVMASGFFLGLWEL